MKTSPVGIELIKRFEGLRLKAYKCPAGMWTIGYGRTFNVSEGMEIPKEQAEAFLKEDLKVYEDSVNDGIEIKITQNQFDAMVSFCFNLGIKAFNDSYIKKYTNEKRFPEVREQFMRFVYAGGKKLDGLIKRRKAEADLYELGEKNVLQEILEKNSSIWKTLEGLQADLHENNEKIRLLLSNQK